MAKKMGKRANGEGTIRQRKDGRWEAIITIGRDFEGKLLRKSFFGKTQKEAKDKKDTYLIEVKTGTYVVPDKQTLGEWITSWLELFVQPRVKQSTYVKYMINLRTHIIPLLGSIELQKISTDQLQRFYNQKAKTLSGSVIAILHQIICSSLKQAVKQRLIINNPAVYTTRPTAKHVEIKPLSKEEIFKYLATASTDRLYVAFLLDITTGLRRGELLALKWSDIDLTKGVLTVRRSLSRVESLDNHKTSLVFSEPKTEASKRQIPILPKVLQELKAHKARQAQEKLLHLKGAYQDQELVFATTAGEPIDPNHLLYKHKKILQKAGLRSEIKIHTLRHTFGTILGQSGENPTNIQKLMGHANIRTTLGIYCHTSLEDKRRTVEKLSSLLLG